MKSIIQEASSVSKAIEKAWIAAGKPKEFSIKVYEEAEKNFIGMTVKSAKIGIFFQEKALVPERPRREPFKRKREAVEANRMPRKIDKKIEERTERPAADQEKKVFDKQPIWNEDMIQAAREWVKKALTAMERPEVTFSTSVNNYYLRLSFDRSLAATEEQERELFRSFSFLMLQALKRKFKRPLRGFKIVVTR